MSAFLKAGIEDKNDPIQDPDKPVEIDTSHSLTLTDENSGMTTIPTAILEAMFEKAHNLIAILGNVIPKPGATDGSFIVAGAYNKIHVVTPGKGGSVTVLV